jgi:ABC-type transport system involved in multi-copper enzyme maturation permease subunit
MTQLIYSIHAPMLLQMQIAGKTFGPMFIFYVISAVLLLAALFLMRRRLIFGFRHGIPAVYRISGMTFAETWRRRIVQVIIFVAAVMLVGMLSITRLSPGEPQKALVSGGLDLMAGLGALVAIFICAFLIPTDIDKRTIYSVLSKPVKRWEFVLGKYFGAMSVVGFFMAIMLVVQLAILASMHYSIYFMPLLVAGILTYIGIAVFAAAVLAISTVASSLTTVIAAVVFWMIGSLSELSHEFVAGAEGPNQAVLGFLSAIVPHLDKFNFRDNVTDLLVINPMLVIQALLYAVGYITVCLIIAAFLFNERQV